MSHQDSNASNITRAQGRRKSKFPANQVIPSNSYFDFFIDGVNYKIAYADFLTALNVTGVIQQAGDVVSVPVLDTQGSVHNIRNLVAGSGIYIGVTAQNGIEIVATGVPGPNLPGVYLTGEPQNLNSSGAASVTVYSTILDNINNASWTLADGTVVGQMKIFHNIDAFGSGNITPDKFYDGTYISVNPTDADNGGVVQLQWDGTEWRVTDLYNSAFPGSPPIVDYV